MLGYEIPFEFWELHIALRSTASTHMLAATNHANNK